MMKRQITIVVGVILLSILWQQIHTSFSDRDTELAVQELLKELNGKYNISFAFGALQDGEYHKDVSGTQPEIKHVYAALVELNQALAKYPTDWLSHVLNRVYIVDKLNISGFRVGGTYLFENDRGTGKTTIIIATDYDITADSKTFLRRVFHHELSSILLIKYPFPKDQWSSFWPDDIVCPTDQKSILQFTQNYTSPLDIQTLHKKGFVSDYGLAGLENDINTYAELMIDDPEKMAILADQFPIIRKKLRILLLFYSGLNPEIQQKIKDGPLAKFLNQL